MTAAKPAVQASRIARATIACCAGLSAFLVAAPALNGAALDRPVRLGRESSTSGLFVAVAQTPSNGLLASDALYDNTGNPANDFYAGQGGAEAIDDLHLVSGGSLDTLVFEYYEPAAGASFSATVWIYDNPGGTDAGITPLAGPYSVGGLASGRQVVAVRLPDAPSIGADLWVGVQFSSATAGLIINNVPSIGSSHDLYVENGEVFWFGGEPKANFGLRVVWASAPVGVTVGPAPAGVTLARPRPNPFRVGSALSYAIVHRGLVRLDVLDLSGRQVCSLVNGVRDAGRHTARWSGRDDAGHSVKAGVYFARLVSAGTVATRRVVFAP